MKQRGSMPRVGTSTASLQHASSYEAGARDTSVPIHVYGGAYRRTRGSETRRGKDPLRGEPAGAHAAPGGARHSNSKVIATVTVY